MTNLEALRFYNKCWGSLPGPFLTKKRLSIEPKETTAFPDEGNRKGARGYLPAPRKVSLFPFR